MLRICSDWFYVAIIDTSFRYLLIHLLWYHSNDVITSAFASQITGVPIVYSTVCSEAEQRKYQSSASLAFVRGIHRWPHEGPVTRKMFPFDDVIMISNRFSLYLIKYFNIIKHCCTTFLIIKSSWSRVTPFWVDMQWSISNNTLLYHCNPLRQECVSTIICIRLLFNNHTEVFIQNLIKSPSREIG